MGNSRYIYRTHSMFVLILFFLVCSVFYLNFEQYYIFAFGMIIVAGLIAYTIKIRKKYLAKMKIDEKGITITYSKKVIKEMKWEDIIKIVAIRNWNDGLFVVSDKPFDEKENYFMRNMDRWEIWWDSKLELDFRKYYDRFPVEIENLEAMPNWIKERYKKSNKINNTKI